MVAINKQPLAGNNRIGGFGHQGIHEESSTPKHLVGQKLETSNGNTYRYGYFAAGVAPGVLVAQDQSVSAVVETDNAATAAAIGATSVVLDDAALSAATAGVYAGAVLHVTDDAGEAYQYNIVDNTAAATNAVTFTLGEPLVVALTTASDVAITGSLWNHLSIATATDYNVSGVSVMTVTTAYYAWVQTGGIATVLADGTIAANASLTLSDGVSGAVHAQDAYTEGAPLGSALFAPDDTGHVGVKLTGLVR